jgi:hypothetical protein
MQQYRIKVNSFLGGHRIQLKSVSYLELDILEHPLFRVSLASPNARNLETEDGSEISLIVENSASESVEIAEVRLCVAGRNVDQLWFTSGCQILAEGLNEIQLKSPVSVPLLDLLDAGQWQFTSSQMPAEGVFQMESTRIIKGHLSFEYRHDSEATDLRNRILKISQDDSAFHASLQVPHDGSLVEAIWGVEVPQADSGW